ncbi:uncharacterized protein LOC128682114 isoform X2 [Plodia interpunctella]|uniref:uncharacterized protein LOC128682114 isoform X2 n=1 Tax=Plodia interpunctella TaxID=58824 RepID=UPI0023685049|nr:uncharacterized protein LOC128682114 isoform X2 [Plodia interpunctella]
MSVQKCVVEGCDLEYDVVCSFSFYKSNICTDQDTKRQEWIEGAMHEDSECLWRHVSLHLCGYHFELDNQGLWIDSPMLPELLTPQGKEAHVPTEEEKKALELIHIEHNYSVEMKEDKPESVSRLNVRQLVDTLGYLSLKNLQRKQLWVVKVETEKAEASITQSEQVITKMQDPKQIIEIIPQSSSAGAEAGAGSGAGAGAGAGAAAGAHSEVLHMLEDGTIPDTFIYEIAEEQEIPMEEVKEIPAAGNTEWMVNIIPEETTKPKYAYIKHCNSGKKKRHFTAEMNEITLQGDFENYYILPDDVDPSSGVEITTSYEPENYIVEEYQHLVLEDRPRKRKEPTESGKKKRKKFSAVRDQVKQLQIKSEDGDWVIENTVAFEQPGEEYEDPKKTPRVRRKNKKYLGYDLD